VITRNPAWRYALPWETPGQLEPQLRNNMTEINEPTTHVINLETMNSFCGDAVMGDRAITLEDAQNPDNDVYFDCQKCYEVLNGAD